MQTEQTFNGQVGHAMPAWPSNLSSGWVWLRRLSGLKTLIPFLVLFALSMWCQREWARQHPIGVEHERQLGLLPRGDVLKPALLGYHHLGADLVWLQAIQVLGERALGVQEYRWLFHALDVATTLDPHFVMVYDAGGMVLTELAGRVDWSNRLLEKGLAANPTVWRLPYLLGFNRFFHQHDYRMAGQFLSLAAQLPGHPAYLPELAARLYVEAKSPELALEFLDTMLQQRQDPETAAALIRRRNEVIIERDCLALEQAVAQYVEQYGSPPSLLEQLVERRILSSIPVEPFGGAYRLDDTMGQVISTTHPRRLRLYRPDDAMQVAAIEEWP